MKNLTENSVFLNGVSVGVSIYQQKVITAHVRGEPLEINGNYYFVQSEQEKLQEAIDHICR